MTPLPSQGVENVKIQEILKKSGDPRGYRRALYNPFWGRVLRLGRLGGRALRLGRLGGRAPRLGTRQARGPKNGDK